VRAARQRQRRGDFLLHLVGLDVGKEDVSSLECAAQAGGGLSRPAADAAALGRALESAVALPADLPAGALVLRATRNGALQDVTVRIAPLAGGAELSARTYSSADTNPRTIPLADGRYRVRAAAVGIDGAPEHRFEIEIAGGGRVERQIDFSTGGLSIGATRNGVLSDVFYQVFAAGDRSRPVAGGRTYRSGTSNPARVTIPVGEYEVVLKALELGGGPSHEAGRVAVRAGEHAEVGHDFASGDLLVGALRGSALVDATVAVRAGGRSVEAGRTYTRSSSNPKRFTLVPGEYEVEVTEIRGEKRRLTVSVAPGGEHTHIVDFAAGQP
jgi:hypothetical protein